MDSSELAALDRRVLWHPFTQQRGWEDEEPPVVIASAQGTNLVDADGRTYIDGVSSLWCNIHGHRHPALDQAVRDQLDRVAHTTMLGLSHEPAIELAARLVELAPHGLSRVFYSDSGSTAVEVALKMAFQQWAHRGQPQRTKFVCLRNAYHGDTIGSVSVGGIDLFHSLYRPLLFDALQVEPGDVPQLVNTLRAHGDEVAAVIVEPLVQGAAGILLQPEGYLRAVRAVTREHGIRLVIVTPSLTVPTHQAREVLPKKYDRADVLHTLQRTSLLAATCFSGNFDLFPEMFQDKLHQPYRQQLVPGMERCLNLRLPGLLGVAISGSGSSVIAFATSDEMRVAEELQRIFTVEGVQTETTFTLADNNGASVTRELIPLMERIGAVLQKLEKS